MKTLLLLFCYLLFISKSPVLGEACTIEGITGTILLIAVDDTQVNFNLLTGTYEDETLAVGTCTSEDSFGTSYFSVTANGTHFLIDTIDEFANFDKNTPKTTSSIQMVTLVCPLTCTSSDTLTIQFQVTDTNNHKPEFSKTSYELKVPSPVMPLTDISVYGDLVVATDIDFSNQDVTFTIQPDDFSITTLSTSTSKDYTAVFSTRRTLQLTGTQEYTITAVDSGNPTQSETVTLTVTVDEEQSLDTPSFEQALYSFNYSVTNEVASLTPNDGSITLTTIKPNSVSEPTLSGIFSAYIGYFTAQFDASTRTIDFNVTDPIPTTSASMLVFTLSVTTDNTASTSIIVYLSDDSTGAPQFSNHYYIGTYNDVTNQVEHDVITITSGGTPVVTISGDYADNFNITYDSTSKSCKISVKTSLPTSALKDSSYITLTLEAAVDDYSDTAAIIIALPEHILQFTETLYTASYSTDHVVTIDNPLGFTTNVTGVSIAVDDTYSKNFEVTLDSDSNEYVISVSEHLPDEVLKKEKEILLTLTATDTYENEAHAVLNIQLPQTETDAPTFSQIVYVLNYTDGSLGIGEDITISNREDKSLITVTQDSYQEYFNISYTDDKFVLNVIKALPEDLLTSRKEIFITLTASEANNDATGKAVVIINWYVKDAPQFSEEYYSGSYPESGEGDIELDNDISFNNVDNPDNIKIQLNSYEEYFGVAYESDKWVLSVLKSLDDATLSENSQLIIILNAIENGNNKEGHSVLVLQLPTQTIQFVEAYYVAAYPKNGTGTIEFEKPIELVNADPTKVTIELDNYLENFQLIFGSNKWYIQILKSLNDTTIKENSELVITLTASQPDKENTGEAILILKLPAEIVPKFSEAYYTADYPEDGVDNMEFEPSLEFSNLDTLEDVVITLDKYNDYFQINYNSSKWYIKIQKTLDDDIILKNSELVMTLTASLFGNTNKDEATLVINLPHDSYIKPPTFSKTYYTAKYPQEGSGVIEFDDPIEFTNVNAISTITLTLDNYADNFDIIYDDGKWAINIKTTLDEATLKANSELVMILTAKQVGKENTGEAVLVLKLPTEVVPKFSEAYYTAHYPNDSAKTIEFEPDLQFSNINNPEDITITLDKYVDNFEIQYDSNRWYITIIESLDDDTLLNNEELVITLTASISDVSDTSETVLLINLPHKNTKEAPEFSKAYYTAQYPDESSDVIPFEDPIEFTNVNDPKTVTITLDNYAENFQVTYDTDKWVINIKSVLDDDILKANSELVMTLTASQTGSDDTGEAALVLKLPKVDSETGPKFSNAYYTADYPEDGTGDIEFTPSLDFSNIENPEDVDVALDKYSENFKIKYTSNKWYITITESLDDETLAENSELIITLTASTSDSTDDGKAILLLNLPNNNNEEAPEFSKAYYTAQYSNEGSDVIAFEDPIEFTNINDPKTVTITLDNYAENFQVTYDTDKWVINIKSVLDDDTLKANSELVMTLTASQTGSDDTGEAALVLQLPKVDSETGPKFSNVYYTADYPEDGTGDIEFTPSLDFSNTENPEVIKITLDKYSENFEINYVSNKWYINITKSLDDDTLSKNSELIITLTASTSDSSDDGKAALVLNLPHNSSEKAPEFSKAYYTAEYTDEDSGVITFENPIEFTNVDPKTVTITVDKYSENFDVIYDTDTWVINIKSPLDEDTLKGNSELVMTLTASQTGTDATGEAALVLKLPKVDSKTGPKFSNAYYTADYPEDGTGDIELIPSLDISNIENPEDVKITLDKYSENFKINYVSNKWYINITKSLDDETLAKNSELIITLTASTSDSSDDGKAALVLNLPHNSSEKAPEFSKAYYTAEYTDEDSGVITFENPIEFTNVDPKTVTITVDKYSENFDVIYDTDTWVINIKSPLDEDTLKGNSELVMTLTASQTGTDATGEAALVLKLPKVDSETGPKFSNAYYTADYPEDGTGDIEFTPSLDFSNIENPEDIDVTVDKYSENFKINYVSNKWHINITKSLDDETLAKNSELIITLTASTSDSSDDGKAALVLNLPHNSSEKAPEFSKAYYTAEYTDADSGVIAFENPIEFTNVDSKTVTITVDNYAENFEVTYATDTWVINIKSPLADDTLKENSELVMTLTASQTATDATGQAALVLKLPKIDSDTIPKFSNAYYIADYPEGGTGYIEFKPSLNFSNIENPEDVHIDLDKYSENFKINYVSNKWYINITKSVDNETLAKNSELIITLTASTSDSSDDGKATLVLNLPRDSDEEAPEFSTAYYIAKYTEGGSGTIEFEDPIEFTNVNDPKSVKITLDNYTTNFEVLYLDRWYINILSNLSKSVLQNNAELVITLIAKEDGSTKTGESALVLLLPSAEESTSPQFEEAFYVATYPESGSGLIDFQPPIAFANVVEEVKLSLDKYSENFQIVYESEEWHINITKSLEDSVLLGNEELLMTLSAKDSNSENEGKSALVMQLPTPANGRTLRFSESYYVANYPEDGKSDIELETPIEFLNSENELDVQIQLVNYADNFQVKYNGSKWYIEIISSLNDTVLLNNTELIMTLTATESENSYEAKSTLILKLPTQNNDTAPIFSAAYYLAEYPEIGSGVIEFLDPLKISNVADQTTIIISLEETYADYFEILYDSDRWYINITKSLEDSLLHSDPEIVITLTAVVSGKVSTGKSALVLRLPTASNDDAPIFSDAYYTAEYVEDDTNVIEFENPVKITNIVDQTSVTITLDKNSDNFEVKYDDGRWYIHILTNLDEDTKDESTELLITLTATSPNYTKEGYSALVLKLPSQQDTLGIQFSNAFYLASYPEKGSGSVDFDKPIEFLNADDSSDIKIELDNYTENFEVLSNGSKWYLNVKSALENSTLQTESELVITLSATQNSKTATSALVIKLPTTAVETQLEFSEAYYVADYPKSGTGELDLEKSIGFVNADDPQTVKITFDSYTDNFDIQYETDSFTIAIKTPLNDTILQENTEIVITLTASENDKKGRSVLVIKLPSSTDKLAPAFTDAYYLATYSESDGKTLELDKEISFSNVDDTNTIDISIDNYEEYFKINYTSGKWVLNIQKNLGDEILSSKKELVVTMTATETGNDRKGYSALVIELPTTDSESGPIFSEAYYLADYPDEYKGAIDFQSPIAFDNVDVSKVTITLDNFTDNFEIIFDDNKWIINVKQRLESSVLTSTSELVMTLTATATDTNKQGYSALVLRLPEEDRVAPIFSETYYTATYVFTSNETQVVFTTPISVTNQEDISGLTIAIDNYNENFNIEYDDESGSWVVNVIEQLGNAILTQKTNLVVAITATNPKNSLTDHAAIDLSLPYLNTENAPKFSQTYYTAIYTISDGVALVTFDATVQITNKDNQNISIGLDNYNNNFEMAYDESSNSWKMNVKNNLDQTVLNRKIDLVMALTAKEKDNDEYGQAVVLIRLPVVNTDDAPKFSSIYYDGVYTGGDEPSVALEDDILITNKDNMSAITIGVDDSYKDNFEVVYNTSSSQWALNLLSPLSNDVFKDSADVILTLTATETGSNKIGQAALVLHLPLEEVKLAPEFSQPHYFAQYKKENNTWKMVLNDTITVTNKADLDKIVVDLEDSTNFQVKSTSTNAWDIIVNNPLSDDTISSTRELIFTLTATEDDNVNEGKSTLIITLPLANQEEIAFSEVHYSASYSSNGELSMNDVVQIITEGDIEKVSISTSGTYSDHFQIEKQDDGSYKVTVKTELPSEALTENNLILTLEAALDDATSYATLVINLPSTTEGNSIEFSEALYSASYEVVDGKGVFTINGTINVETDEDDTNVKPSISNSDGYHTYFEINYSSNVVTVTATDIPTEVLAQNSFIPLVLTVGIEGTSAESSAVLNVEINYEQSETSIAFSNILYSGTYEVVDGIGALQITDTISIDTEEIDDNINIVITNEYADFFNVELSENEVKITLKNQLTETIVNSSSVVPLALRAGIAGTSVIAEAVVNIAIIYESDEDDPESIEFGSVLYTAEYSVSDGKGSLTLDQSIKVISTSSDIEPTISADSVYGEYFDVSYANNEVLVELKENLPDDVVQSNTFIALTLEVRIKDTVHQSSAVLNINIESGSNNDQGSIAFSSLLYNAKYEIIDNSPNLTYGAITISTDPSDSNVEVKITNEYDSYFSVTYTDKVVYINIEKELTEEILTGLSVVPLILQAQIEGTTYRASAVVNIAIIYDSDGDTDFVQFTSVLYNGEYTIEDGKSSLAIDDSIKIVSSREDSDIVVYISEDSLYRDYFLATCVERIVTVTLTKSLPSAAVKSNFVALTLNVGILNTTHSSSAVLNIGINNKDDNSDSNDDDDDEDSKTELHHLRITFIVVTAILSVLLLACIAGALAYYFLKIRSDNYANLEEDGSGRVRFGKNSLSRSPSSNKSSALEERRPTGFIFHPIKEDTLENSDSPKDDKDRRKSVAFDDNVEKLQIDSLNDDDIDTYSSDKSQVTHV